MYFIYPGLPGSSYVLNENIFQFISSIYVSACTQEYRTILYMITDKRYINQQISCMYSKLKQLN